MKIPKTKNSHRFGKDLTKKQKNANDKESAKCALRREDLIFATHYLNQKFK